MAKGIKMKLPSKKVQEFIYNSNKIENYDYVVHANMKEPLVKNHVKAYNFMYKVAKNKKTPITSKAIREIHGILMENLLHPSETGQYRKCRVWVGVTEKDPFKDVPLLVERLVNTINKGPDRDDIEEWCWLLHDEFECIHPFVDGNGRTGRLLLNLIRFKYGLPLKIVRYEDRWGYYGNIMDYESVRDIHGYKEKDK